jgi:hypothetical protein
VHQILRIAMAFEHLTSMQDLLEPVITRFANEYAQDSDVTVAVAALRRHGTSKGGLVVPLRAGDVGAVSPKSGSKGRGRRSAAQRTQSDA